jgi:septum formation protein
VPTLVLASASPRRRELLRGLCADFVVAPSRADETLPAGPATTAAVLLALRKARAVAAGRREGIVLGADTLVVIDGEGLGKPASAEDARHMLRRLRGREHDVVTGVAVVDAATGREASEVVVSRVRMADYSESAIDAYVAGGEPLDKAGAYAIQGEGGALVAALEGSWSNVVGLPVEATRRLLAAFGVVTAPVAG